MHSLRVSCTFCVMAAGGGRRGAAGCGAPPRAASCRLRSARRCSSVQSPHRKVCYDAAVTLLLVGVLICLHLPRYRSHRPAPPVAAATCGGEASWRGLLAGPPGEASWRGAGRLLLTLSLASVLGEPTTQPRCEEAEEGEEGAGAEEGEEHREHMTTTGREEEEEEEEEEAATHEPGSGDSVCSVLALVLPHLMKTS
ncbi:hypothetical protein EYF80_042090 [Liparis tanakae]|uniref:Uncharacterized protein n=1 Tax=Liparis tanakae TaxID=230148 RepID=A0A4Z2G499_9TELE|nr:hypothetical protein EYF80_042090 [Liparis tanakae]